MTAERLPALTVDREPNGGRQIRPASVHAADGPPAEPAQSPRLPAPGAEATAASVHHALNEALAAQNVVGVAACDSDGMLTMMNGQMEHIMGQSFRPLPLRRWSARFRLYDEDGTTPLGPGEDPLARALSGQHVVDTIICIRPVAEAVRFLRCNAAPLAGPSTTALGAVVFVVDITRQITESRELDVLRDRLVAAVNHEVRTPLAAVVGHLELLEDMIDEVPPGARWSWQGLIGGTRRLQAAVDTITELAHLATRTRNAR